ncbi:uncharacterized protein LOC115685476 [Syzygium oleosum]|uniref:uncharacterized protein LOC115685476 n=1 Tax=Syzygium oleosum TaxID=219896 RepID=UPI0024BB78D0|nr:uncharacterized protein LOC115685476 [Syzygium oleosum]
MVLWEITLGTAYFLGLKRTYKLAFRIQRRLIAPKHPKIRQFVQRRTRAIFDVALKVHRNIQERDIEVGRNLGNWILRWLDRIKPSAQIRGSSSGGSPSSSSTSMNMTKQIKGTAQWKDPGTFSSSKNAESDRRMFASLKNTWPKPFPTITMMMQSAKPAGRITQYRHASTYGSELPRSHLTRGQYGGVFREDIMQWMLHK